ncbi:MAG: MFS transporter [Nitrososphaerota archaeon]|nr:MFS transporter [Nitrososphaerota archaeon]MDG6969404.1 MFS transporter [Nitrososphaerota archaeon]MDG6982658.1 MFS transporter [Nitrososphaerota archaeon]MDG6987317.1 MFS transporter [Nitrososphaerota archaeon]MDG7015399.1 MFS transporter [Nitrososphaerota archaeon]
MNGDQAISNGRPTDTRSLTYLAVLRALRSVAAGMVNVAFPFLVLTELHLGTLLLGLMYAAATVATALLGLGIGIAADLVGRRISFVVAVVLLPLSAFLVVASTSVPSLFVAAVIGGISATGSLPGGGVGGAAQPIQSILTTELTSRKDRTRYFSLMAFISGMASAAGAYLGGFGAIQDVFAVAAVLGAASVLFIPLVRVEKSARRPFSMKSRRAIGKFSLTGMLNGLSQGLVTPFLIPFFIVLYSVTRQEMNVFAAASGLTGSFALLLAPKIERRLGFLRGMVATRGVSVVLSVLMPLVRLLPVSLAIYLLLPATRVMALPVQQAAMMDMVSENERGTAFGINQTTRLVASSGGTYFSGFEFAAGETDPVAIDYPFALYAVVLALNLGLYWWFFRRYRPPSGVRAEPGK